MNNNLTIMIVDDEPVNLILLEEIAKTMDHHPITFSDSIKALA
jgi:CheY-like chemotaxis protein